MSGDQSTLGQVDDTIASLAFRWAPDDSMMVDFKIRSEQTRGNPSSRDMEELDIMTAPLGAHIAQLNRQLINNGEPALVQSDPRLLLDDYTVRVISRYCIGIVERSVVTKKQSLTLSNAALQLETTL